MLFDTFISQLLKSDQSGLSSNSGRGAKEKRVNSHVNGEEYYFNCQAPPATVLPQALQCQIPTTFLLTDFYGEMRDMNGNDITLPQKEQTYLECCWTSNFLIILLREAPYLVPYLPTIPTLTVLFVIFVYFYSKLSSTL